MKQADEKPRWYYVDEAGDPVIYGKGKSVIIGTEGCSRTFSVGFLRIYDPQAIRSKLVDVRLEILNDRYFKDIPSIIKTQRAFHAKDDCPEVRKLVYSALEKMDFGAQVVVGRKQESIFKGYHQSSQDRFYGDLVSNLFTNQLHLAHENTIIFARRGNKAKQQALRSAVELGVEKFRRKSTEAANTKVNIETSQPAQETVLQAADYVLWAVQRAFERGEMRYFEFMRDKIELVFDIYDYAVKKTAQIITTEARTHSTSKKPVPLAKLHSRSNGMKPTFTKANQLCISCPKTGIERKQIRPCSIPADATGRHRSDRVLAAGFVRLV